MRHASARAVYVNFPLLVNHSACDGGAGGAAYSGPLEGAGLNPEHLTLAD